MIQRFVATKHHCLFVNMAGVEQGNFNNEEYIEEVARKECVYHRNNKDFKDTNKRANYWEKSGRNLL